MSDLSCALLIIGAGPGGYVCAIRAGQLGIDTIIVDSEPAGGTCLNVGCIPSKALIHAADEFHRIQQLSSCSDQIQKKSPLGVTAHGVSIDFAKTRDWKDSIVQRLNGGVSSLLKKAGVNLVVGKARFRDGKSVTVATESGVLQISAENVVIATGSTPIELAALPFTKDNIMSSTQALSLASIPDSLTVIGAGYIGLELGIAYAKLGATVTIVESAERILMQYDPQLTQPVVNRLESLGVNVKINTSATSYQSATAELMLEDRSGMTSSLIADKVLVTVGRKPQLEGWGLTELDLTLNNGFIAIDAKCQTSMRGVYAVGDITGEPMLAHRAMAQGEMVAELLSGLPLEWDKRCIPAVCFTDPEIVSVGLSAQTAMDESLPVTVSEFPFQANGRAMSVEHTEGFIRVVASEDSQTIVGIEAVGTGIAELSAAFSLAIEMGARTSDVAATVHAHPTMSEGFQEACMQALGHALHL